MTAKSWVVAVFFMATAALFQYGCQPTGPSPLQIKLNSAVERKASIDERIIDWGAPDKKEPLSDGRIVYTWKMPWTSIGVNYAVSGDQAYSMQHACTIVITVTSDNVVQSYNYRDC